MMPIEHAIWWMYPYNILLGHEGKMAVEGVLKVSICCPFLSVLFISRSFPLSSFSYTPLIFPYLSFFFIIPSLPFQDRKHMMPITRKQWWEVWVWLDLLYGANKQIELSQGMGMFIVVGVRSLTVGERSRTRQEDDTRGP